MMEQIHDIDLSYRPATYWPEALTQEQLISRISGKVRQDIAREILQTEGFPGLTPFLAREELPEDEKQAWGRIHPDLMGGEYLPPLLDGEVEIAHVSLASTTSDQISIRARREDDVIIYRIVNEYEEEGFVYQPLFDRSDEPLTLGELVRLLDGSEIQGDIFSGGVIRAHWEQCIEFDPDVDAALQFVSAHSCFYPQLADYYEGVGEEWRKKHETHDEEEWD
ncbi:hypothetical protein QVG61_00245 [Thiohalobacter sp. IOR34]|uniref:hypothetical protein n=1 Tax=Thiohalobacter sp. IOR34 TaxID=3057176 RepID=UPI0025B09A9C|nr:hypothetical protein [Thiohalobacter sp. IOR34]WJW75556.1 hypothetical protein QVG61_00245 [Thiohalobacter sp. IOR34]